MLWPVLASQRGDLYCRFRLSWSAATLRLYRADGAWQEILAATVQGEVHVVGAAFSTGFGSSGRWRVLDP